MKAPHLSESPFAYRGVTVEGQRRDGGMQLRHEELQERKKGTGSAGAAAAPEDSRAALLGTARHTVTDRQERVHDKMVDLFNVGRAGDVVKMAAEGLAVAGGLRSARPELAADIHGTTCSGTA